MPKVLHDRVNKIKDKNPAMPDGEAWGIATKQLQGKNVLPKKNNKRSGGRKLAPNDPCSVMMTKKEKAFK